MSDRYDAGLLNDFGGGNVEWWQDYIRAELGRAHDFYSAALDAAEAEKARAVEALQTLYGIIASNRVIKDGPHTVVLPDGSVHSGPVVDYLHSLMGVIQDYIAAALRTGAKP